MLNRITELLNKKNAQVIVIDSIQTMYTDILNSAAGSVSQVREAAAQLVQYAKSNGHCRFFSGHVTKEGMLAGPRVLEHMVDTVLYFEGQNDSRFRVFGPLKIRFGAMNELGVFGMAEKGLRCNDQSFCDFFVPFCQTYSRQCCHGYVGRHASSIS